MTATEIANVKYPTPPGQALLGHLIEIEMLRLVAALQGIGQHEIAAELSKRI